MWLERTEKIPREREKVWRWQRELKHTGCMIRCWVHWCFTWFPCWWLAQKSCREYLGGGLKMMDGLSGFVKDLGWGNDGGLERVEGPLSCVGVICLFDQLVIMGDQSTHQAQLLFFWTGVRLFLPTFLLLCRLSRFLSPYQHLFSAISSFFSVSISDGKSNSIRGADHLAQLTSRSCCFQLANGLSFKPLLLFLIYHI